MGALDKIFGLVLIGAGIAIFIVYTLFIIVPRSDMKDIL